MNIWEFEARLVYCESTETPKVVTQRNPVLKKGFKFSNECSEEQSRFKRAQRLTG